MCDVFIFPPSCWWKCRCNSWSSSSLFVPWGEVPYGESKTIKYKEAGSMTMVELIYQLWVPNSGLHLCERENFSFVQATSLKINFFLSANGTVSDRRFFQVCYSPWPSIYIRYTGRSEIIDVAPMLSLRVDLRMEDIWNMWDMTQL